MTTPFSRLPQVLRVLLIPSARGDRWVAQCLEIDLAAEGDSISDVRKVWRRTFVCGWLDARSRGVEAFKGFKPAPQWYLDAFDKAEKVEDEPLFIPGDLMEKDEVPGPVGTANFFQAHSSAECPP